MIGVLAALGRGRSAAARALFFGSAAGVGFALQSSVTKEFTTVLGHGLGAILSSWTVYVLILSAIVGFALQQLALKTGVLAPAMASSNAVTLFASVLFGISVFGEKLSNGDTRLGPAIIGLVLALVGISLLASTEPPEPGRPDTAARPAPPGQTTREPGSRGAVVCPRCSGSGGHHRCGPLSRGGARGLPVGIAHADGHPEVGVFQHGPSVRRTCASTGWNVRDVDRQVGQPRLVHRSGPGRRIAVAVEVQELEHQPVQLEGRPR